MRIKATCIAEPRTILWNGMEKLTGIYKKSVKGPVRLLRSGVKDDTIGNKKVHGGALMACYLFSTDQYPYWKKRYPDLEWEWGMFGENLSVSGLDESEMRVGDIYKIGTSQVQVTIPREPCYRLGIKFNDQGIIKAFVEHGYPGTYVKILEEGEVAAGDEMQLIRQSDNPLSVRDMFLLSYHPEKYPDLLELALANTAVPEYKKEKWLQKIKKGN